MPFRRVKCRDGSSWPARAAPETRIRYGVTAWSRTVCSSRGTPGCSKYGFDAEVIIRRRAHHDDD
jgi:hypothetical protein